jgi:hypothetical protein
MSGSVGPKLDKAQVVLVDAEGHEVRLASGDLPGFEATEPPFLWRAAEETVGSL